jgi:hypothetical protein
LTGKAAAAWVDCLPSLLATVHLSFPDHGDTLPSPAREVGEARWPSSLVRPRRADAPPPRAVRGHHPLLEEREVESGRRGGPRGNCLIDARRDATIVLEYLLL